MVRSRSFSVLLLSLIAMGCDASSKASPAPSPDPSKGADDRVKGASSTTGPQPSGPVVFETPDVLASKVEIKSYHLLVRDGTKGYSGYCVASVKKPNLPEEMLQSVEVTEGACPSSLKINNKSAPMAYVCPVRTAVDRSQQQTILYGTLNTDLGFKPIKEVGQDIINAFCAM